MKIFILFLVFFKFSYAFAQEGSAIEKRNILFYFFDTTNSKTEFTSKILGRKSDSLLISDVELLVENNNSVVDTIKCKYKNNTVFFNKITSPENNFIKILLSVRLKLSIYRKQYDERLTLNYTQFYKQTNESSDISISFIRERNNLFRISISKLDFPFIIASQYSLSEILGLYNKRSKY